MINSIIILINIITLLATIFLVGHIEHKNDEIQDRIDELSMIECRLSDMMDKLAVILCYRDNN